MSFQRLDARSRALEACLYCANLCRQSCPVERVDGRVSSSPWAKMSVVQHLRTGRLALNADTVASLYRCMGCGGCTEVCGHSIDVEGTLMAARRAAVEAGWAPVGLDRLRSPRWDGGLLADSEWLQVDPSVLLIAGHEAAAPGMAALLGVTTSIQDDQLGLSATSWMDVGYRLWAGGFEAAFVAQAQSVQKALEGVRHVVVASPEALYLLQTVYPKHGVVIEAELRHTTEILLPLVLGAELNRQEGRTAYHDSCHLARHLSLVDAPRAILERVLVDPLVELTHHGMKTQCCGGTGCVPETNPERARAMAQLIIEDAISLRAERLVTFAPECLVGFRESAGGDLAIVDGLTLVGDAIRGAGV